LHEVALPPDIKGFQQVAYDSIDPKPRNVYIDKDGNTIVQFKVGAKEKLEAEIQGSAKILAKQNDPEKGGTFEQLPKNLVRTYTKKQKYWETDSKAVQELAEKLKDPELTVSQNAQRVYEFITKNLEYDLSAEKEKALVRHGAETALTTEDVYACMEFTDTFIATTRAMGIPARELNGHAFANSEGNTPISINLKSGDSLHAWPQYYDPSFGWVAVDPTWGNTSGGTDYFTKLDTNHFAFVIKGRSSELPLPAGMYRYEEDAKLVDVAFAQNGTSFERFYKDLTIEKKLNLNLVEIIRGNSKYRVENSGSTILHNVGNTEKTLAPGQKTNVYVPRINDIISFEDFAGIRYDKRISTE
jgi:hypothetical protein